MSHVVNQLNVSSEQTGELDLLEDFFDELVSAEQDDLICVRSLRRVAEVMASGKRFVHATYAVETRSNEVFAAFHVGVTRWIKLRSYERLG